MRMSFLSTDGSQSLGEGDKIPPEVLFHVVNNPQLYAIVKHNYPHLFRHYVDQQPLQPHRHPPGTWHRVTAQTIGRK